jgi:spermidine synthase
VIRIARDETYFTYLEDTAAHVEIIEGDARIALQAEREQGERPPFDTLVVDAFSSDTIPIHLLTREAFDVYLDSLRPDGLLAFHLSSQRLDLLPVVARLGTDHGLHVLVVTNDERPQLLSDSSTWMLMSSDASRIESVEMAVRRHLQRRELPATAMIAERPTDDMLERAPVWTDDYSDLFGVLRPLPVRLRTE